MNNTNYKFTVKNKVGELIPNEDRLIENIIYSNSGYKITVKMDGNYTSEYRKEVLWDFGDGEKVKGGQVEHYYKRPGRYTISATLFNYERVGFPLNYTVDVVVKELIPTMLRFDETATKKEIKCSKIERIAKVECLISNITDAPLDVVVKRIFDKNKEESSKDKSYFDVKDTLNFHMDQYWTTLKNDQVLYYNTNKVYQSDLNPSEVFNPSYTAIYYRLVKTTDNTLGLKFYQVLPYKDLDRQAKQIKVLDHTSTVDNEVWSVYNIENVYDVSKLPQDAVYCGMRGFADIFYKTDFIDDVSTFSIFYDTEVGDITRQMYSAGNYTNITPLGLTVGTALNEINADNFKVALSGNYFLNDTITDIKISDTSSSIFIDPYLEGSLYNGLDITCYLMPLFYYTDEDDVKLADNSYYIPKDVQIKVADAYNNLNGNGKYGESSLVVQPKDKYEYQLKDWLYKIPIQLNNYIDVVIKTETTSPKGNTESIDIRLCQKPLRSLTDLVIPQEKVTEVNINELLNAYMKHPMFLETPNTREFIRLYLNSFVDKVQTESNNFIDNVANVKTCYLSHLISHLQMMGEEVYEYDNSHLEGINDLKKFSRLLSMNHSDLIGHSTSLDWDVEVNMDYKGKNVGRKLKPDDVLTLCIPTAAEDTEEYYNNFAKVTHVNGEKVDGDGCNLIVRDKFAEKTEFINFRNCLISKLKTRDDDVNVNEVRLCDYIEEQCGWNLLLPDGFKTMIDKIRKYEAEIKLLEELEKSPSLKDYEKADILEKVRIYKNEVSLLYKRKGDVLQGYYNFYLLKPERDVIRQGNFISEDYITDEIADPNEWGRQWGITHDILMKILLTNAKLLSRRDVIPDRGYPYQEYWETAIINESKNFNNFIKTDDASEGLNIWVNESQEKRYDVTGSMTIRGKIYSEGTNTLEVRLQNCLIDREDEFSLGVSSGEKIQVEVVGRDITTSTHVIDLYGDSLVEVEGKEKENKKSNLQITISGSIDAPVITVNGDIYYNPNVIKGQTGGSFTICGGNAPTSDLEGETIVVDSQFVNAKGEVDTEFEKGIPFHLPVNVNANISGSGEHRAEITIDKITFFNVDSINEVLSNPDVTFTNYDKLLLSFYVDKDGNIVDGPDGDKTDKDNQIRTGKTYIRGSYTDIYGKTNYYKGKYSLYEQLGEDNTQKGVWIDVGIYGSTKGIGWSLRCGSDSDVGGDNKFDFVYDYPSTGASYTYANNTDEQTITYTEKDFSVTLKPVKPNSKPITSKIEDIKLKLSKLSEGVYRLHVTGEYKADNKKGWATTKDIDQYVDIAVDSFGNIYSYIKGKKQFYTVFYAFEAGETYGLENETPIYTDGDDFNIEFTLSGNIINDTNLVLNAKQDKAYGIYADLFTDFASNNKFKVEVKNTDEVFKKFKISFVGNDGKPYNKKVYRKGEHQDDEVRMKIEFVLVTQNKPSSITPIFRDEVKSTYITGPLGRECVFYIDDNGKNFLRKKDTMALRATDNYYSHQFESIYFVTPSIDATEAYDIFDSDDTASADKRIIIASDFSIYALDLTLTKKKIIKVDFEKPIPSSKVGTNLGMYKAQCEVSGTSQFFYPDKNGEVISISYTIEPTVSFIQKVGTVDYEHTYDVLKIADTQTKKYIVKETGENEYNIVDADDEANDITYNLTYHYIDGDESGEDDIDGDVNYIINLALKPSLNSNEDGGFLLSLVESKCHLDVIERNFNKKSYTIDWGTYGDGESLIGTTELNCYSVISEDGNETIVTVSLGESDLYVKGVEVDNDNIILTSDSNNTIILNTDMNGKGTITIRASQYENGKSCELIQNIEIEFKNGEPSYKFDVPQISFRDDSYKINRYIGSWLKEEDIPVITGCYTISGKKDSDYHGIKGEEFEGKLNICSPKINGVVLDVESIEIDGKAVTPNKVTIGDLTLTTAKIQLYVDSSNGDNSDDDSSDYDRRLHEIAKPVPVNINLKKGKWELTDEFEFYRNINDDDMVNETQDVFELTVSHPSGDFSWEVPSLVATPVNLGESYITDAIKYDELHIKNTPNKVVGNCVITPNFDVTITEIPVDETVTVKDSSGKLEVTANFGNTFTINGVTLNAPSQSYSVGYGEDGKVYSDGNVKSISFSDNDGMYTLTGDIKVSGNVTDDTFKCEITNLNFDATIKSISGNFTISGYTNNEKNFVEFGTDKSFNVDFSFNGTYAKTSEASLNLNKDSNTSYKINGLELKNEPTVVDIPVDAEGDFTQTIPFNFWDSLELVSLKGNLVLSGNIKDNDNITISSNDDVEIHAKSIDIEAEEEAANTTGESIYGWLSVTPTNGGEFPNNGKIGKNPNVAVTVEAFKVNDVPITDVSVNNNTTTIPLTLNESTGDIYTVSYNYSGKSIGNAITLDCVCEINTKDKTDESYIIGTKTTVTNVTFANDISCNVTIDGDDLTVRNSKYENNKVDITLGKEISYDIVFLDDKNTVGTDDDTWENYIRWEAITLTTSDPNRTIPMTGTTVDSSDYPDTITYQKIVEDEVIASKTYKFTWSGTVVENNGVLEGLTCTVEGPVEWIKDTPYATYTFDEGDLSGSLVVSSDNRLIDETLTFTLKEQEIEYDGISLHLDGVPCSWTVTPNFENGGKGSFDTTSQNFTLTNKDKTIEVTGSVLVNGDVINGFTITVNVISVKDNREDNYISYTNDGNYRIARLKALTNGDNLFRNQSIESFGATMPKLTTARNMFRGCSNLTNFASNMPELTDASNMFNGCSKLTTFSGMLTNLNKATNMFKGCNLDKQSVKNIINQLSNGEGSSANAIEVITIGMKETECTEDFVNYLIANEYITNMAGQVWKLNIEKTTSYNT